MVKDHSDSEKGNPLPPHRLLLSINSKGSFICTIHRQDSTYHGLWYTSRGALAGTRNSPMGPMKDRSDDPSHHDSIIQEIENITQAGVSQGERNTYEICI